MTVLRASITKFPVVYALIVALLVILAVGLVTQVDTSSLGTAFDSNTISHQDGDPPPECRPAGQYGFPHPSKPECKHKEEKHDNKGGLTNNGGQNLP